jgi:hypothetical protein
MKELFDKLTADGGLLRVRAALAMGMTAAGCLMYVNSGTVPSEFLVLWSGAVAHYFGSRTQVPTN